MTRVASLSSGRNSREAQEMIQDEKVVLKEREKAKEISRVSISDPATTAAQYLSSTAFFQFSIMVTMASFYRWLSFIAESTTVAPMSHGYGGYQTATSLPNYTTYATTGYYTEAHKYYSTPIPATIPMLQLISPLRPTSTAPPRHRNITPHPTPLQNTTPPENRSTTRLRMLPQLSTPAYYTEAPKYNSAPAYYTEALNTTLYPATYPQLRRPSIMQYLLTTLWLLHRTTLIRITTPRFQFTTPKSTLHPATTLELLFTATPRNLSITPLLTLFRPTTPKLRSISLPRATTPLRQLNVTSYIHNLRFFR